jgi:hypothetical protein
MATKNVFLMNNYTLHKKYSFKKGNTGYEIVRHYDVPGLTRHSLGAAYTRNNQSSNLFD